MYRQAAKALLGLPKFRCCVAQAAELRARSLPPLHCFASRARCATAFAHGRVLHVLSAASHSATNAKPDVQANLRQALELGVQLPELCSGCGVRLQADTTDAPGYFQVSQRLLKQLANLQADSQQVATSQQDAAADNLQAEISMDTKEDADRLQRQQDVEPSTSSSEEDTMPAILCARCYSLRHYGHVVSQHGEAALPGFDLNKKVGRKIKLQKYRRAVVLCVVDMADFDGSLPREALQELLPGLEEGEYGSQAGLGYRLVVAASKVDLLPSQATQTRLQAWVHRRCRQAGLPSPAAVHLISSIKGTGVKEVLGSVQEMVGARGDVWVVGAQNAGKSSLINAMQRLAGLKGSQQLTTAAQPGTTLGMLKVEGLLQSGCRMWDTPGVPHHFQLSSKLTADEVRMLLPRRQLKPRTFRASADQTVFLGGLARIDVVQIPAQTIYLTVWASDEVSCHYGRTDKADDRLTINGGSLLVPPVGGSVQMAELGPLLPQDILLEGSNWKESSVDIAIAGLGWIAVGVKGPADLRLWVHEGVGVTTHASMLPDYAQALERPGFSSSNLKAAVKGKDKSGKGGSK